MNGQPISAGCYAMTIGEILDRIFRLLRNRWRPLIAVASAPAAAVFLAYGAAIAFAQPWKTANRLPSASFAATPVAWAALVFATILFLLMIAICVLSEGAATEAALRADLDGNPTFRAAYMAVLPRTGQLLGLWLLRSLYFLAPALAGALLAGLGALAWGRVFSAPVGPLGWFFLIPALVLLYLGWLAYVIYITLRLSMAVPACLEEGVGAWAAVRRSGQLTRGVKGRIFLVSLVVYAATYACLLVISILLFGSAALGSAVYSLYSVHIPQLAAAVVVTIFALMCFALFVLWIASAWAVCFLVFAVIYHDRRRCESPAI